MKQIREEFPDKLFYSLEERLSTACLYSAEIFSGEALEETIKIFRFANQKENLKKYFILRTFSDNKSTVEIHDTCRHHRKKTIGKLGEYLPPEILKAEFGEIPDIPPELPNWGIGSYEEGSNTCHHAYYYPDGTSKLYENGKKYSVND